MENKNTKGNNSVSESVIRRTAPQKKDDKYVLNIEKNTKNNSQYQSNRPAKNGEIYFANYQKNRSERAKQVYASSYDASKKPNAKADGSTQLFDNRKLAGSNTNASRYVSKNRQINNPQNMQRRPQQKSRTNSKQTGNLKMLSKETKDNFFKQAQKIRNSSRASRFSKRANRRKQPNYMRNFLASVISVVLVTAILSGIGIGCINDVLAINGNDEETIVQIEKDANMNDVIKELKKNKLIHSKAFCKAFATFRGYSDEEYQSGVYYLSTEMGIEGMLNEVMGLNSSDSDEVVSLTFPEGWTVQQIMDKLVKNEVIDSKEKFINALNFDYKYDFIESRKDVVTILEGYMFPDTYDFFVGESASSIIRKFLDNFSAKWTKEYAQRAKAMNLSAGDIITIASIIQKEAGNSEQMPGISAVIHNRLKNPVDYPLIQCDSTANYYKNYISGIVGEGRESAYKDFYDTTVRKGLPTGPICNPSIEAIVAALYPDTTLTAVYFNHDDNGKVYYANNEVEFSRNLREAENVNRKLDQQDKYF